MRAPSETLRIEVNGLLLNKSIGSKVALVATVLDGTQRSNTVEVKTEDKHIVTVTFRSPLNEPLTGLVEFHGTVQSKGALLCDYYLAFPQELAQTYDGALANDAVMLMHSINNPWKS